MMGTIDANPIFRMNWYAILEAVVLAVSLFLVCFAIFMLAMSDKFI